MTLINFIVTSLLLIPLIWVISDFKTGKIKNKFIFPYLVCLIILTFFIKWFYNYSSNLIELFIVLFFWYLFYINNKWWAWDGKYLIILWLSWSIIWYLKWYENVIILFLSYSFLLISTFITFYIIKNYKKLKWIKTKKLDLLNNFFYFNIIFLIWNLITIYFKNSYTFLVIFWIMYLIIPSINKIKLNTYFKFIFSLFLVFIFYYYDLLNIWYDIWFIIYLTFIFLSWIIENIFDKIDIKEIRVIDIKQWDILTNDSIKEIKNKIEIELHESPLQWSDVYEIIKAYKESEMNKVITIYKDIRIWIFLYIWFVITIISLILKN
jgi:hypothetical protein